MSVTKTNTDNDNESNEIDLGRLIGELIDHRKIIISVTTLFAFLSIVYALFATPVYQADALVQVEQKQANAILSNITQMLPDSQPQSAPEIALLQSRMILGKTVDDLNLQIQVNQHHFPVFGEGWSRLTGAVKSKIYVSRFTVVNQNSDEDISATISVLDNKHYVLSGDGYQIEGTIGKLIEENGITIKVDAIDAAAGATFDVLLTTRLKAIEELKKVFTVSDQSKDSGMLTLSITGTDQFLVKKILDSISDNYQAQNISRQAAQDEKSLEFLNSQLPAVRDDLNISEDKLNAYRKKSDSVDLSLEAKSVLDQIVNADNQLNELTFRESEISQLYTKDHPTYKALLEKKKTLQNEKAKLNKRVSGMPETQQEILRLSRDVESGRAVYMQLLNRQQELNIAKSSAIGNVRIVDDAVTQPKPVKPKKALVILIGTLLGCIVSVGLILIRVFLRRGIESPEQLEEKGINVYASIPIAELNANSTKTRINKKIKSIKQVETSLLAFENPADIAIEAIRGLRTSLHFAMMESTNNILMISGASPNAGKTFISTNLAAIVAQTGIKVLIIDADMRKGYIHHLFDVANENGLSDILAGKSSLDRAIKHIPNSNLDFISRGMVPPNPAELLMHQNFSNLIEDVKKQYDLVVIDTPPILAVTDAAIIGRYVGAAMLVARFELNTVKEMEVSYKRFEQSGIHVKGCILNGVIKKASSYYGYGYNHYGYSYSERK